MARLVKRLSEVYGKGVQKVERFEAPFQCECVSCVALRAADLLGLKVLWEDGDIVCFSGDEAAYVINCNGLELVELLFVLSMS